MGTLYIVSTPIGNLEDITIRALRVLTSVDIIVSENPKATGLLLQLLKTRLPDFFISGQKEEIISMNEFEEEFKLYEILNHLKQGAKIALVSEAGTPLISDPGFKLVRLARKEQIEIVAIPGVSAPITSLSISGLPTDKFLFLGFPPKSESKSQKMFEDLQASLAVLSEKKLNPTVIFFESPHRLVNTLNSLREVFGDIEVVVARELTKKFEEVKKENVSSVLKKYDSNAPKGEFTILFNLKT